VKNKKEDNNMSQVLKCDSCGREMDPKEKFWKIDERYTDGYGEQKDLIAGEYDFGNRDFCTECIGLINRFITMPTEEKRKLLKGENILATGDVKPKRKYTKRKNAAGSDTDDKDDIKSTGDSNKNKADGKKMDEGKVMALYRAKNPWKPADIAEEMGTDVDTVNEIILRNMHKRNFT
jgi:hypothetical protein